MDATITVFATLRWIDDRNAAALGYGELGDEHYRAGRWVIEGPAGEHIRDIEAGDVDPFATEPLTEADVERVKTYARADLDGTHSVCGPLPGGLGPWVELPGVQLPNTLHTSEPYAAK